MNLLGFKKNIPINFNSRKDNPFWALQKDLNKTMRDFYDWFEPINYNMEKFENLSLTPAIDIVEDNENFKVEVEMPGMGEEDIKVAINNGIFTIKGEKTTSKQDKDKNYMMREITYGSYERNIPLPDSIDIDKAKASFKKGMLWVNIPKNPNIAKEGCVIQVEKA